MGRFTPEELDRMAPGRSPEELADLDMTDGDWARKMAESEAARVQAAHNLETAKAAGVHELNTLRFDPDVIAYAKNIQGERNLDDVIEGIVAPHREAYLASFDTKAPVAKHRPGVNELAFNRLLGGTS